MVFDPPPSDGQSDVAALDLTLPQAPCLEASVEVIVASDGSSKGMSILVLFMGPSGSPNSLGYHCRKLGVDCDELDPQNGSTGGLANNAV